MVGFSGREIIEGELILGSDIVVNERHERRAINAIIDVLAWFPINIYSRLLSCISYVCLTCFINSNLLVIQ